MNRILYKDIQTFSLHSEYFKSFFYVFQLIVNK